jgi:hypothetical protein
MCATAARDTSSIADDALRECLTLIQIKPSTGAGLFEPANHPTTTHYDLCSGTGLIGAIGEPIPASCAEVS